MSSIEAVKPSVNPQDAQGPREPALERVASSELYILPPAQKLTTVPTSPLQAISPNAGVKPSPVTEVSSPAATIPLAGPNKESFWESLLHKVGPAARAVGTFVSRTLLLGGSLALISCIGLGIVGNPATLSVLVFGGVGLAIGALLGTIVEYSRR